MKCKKCNKCGMLFIKNDYADRTSKYAHYYKGNTGHWVKCPYCKGTKIRKPDPNNYHNNVDYWNACREYEYEMQRL